MRKLRIPIIHQSGTFTVAELSNPSEKYIVIDYDEELDIISYKYGRFNEHCIYQSGIGDIFEDTQVVYIGGKLSAVYAYSQAANELLPVLFQFDDLENGFSAELKEKIVECADKCTAEFLDMLEKKEKPLCSITPEIFFDGQAVQLGLHDENDQFYTELSRPVSCLLECVCLCVPDEMSCDVLENVAKIVREKLSADISKRFDVSEDFQVYDAEMYD